MRKVENAIVSPLGLLLIINSKWAPVLLTES
jgi:hypothetical protein